MVARSSKEDRVGRPSVTITVTENERQVLERWARAKTAPQRIVERCRIVLLSAEGLPNETQADKLGIDRQCVRRWRHRWAKARPALDAAAHREASAKDLEKLIVGILADDERPGAPVKFTPEQITGIIALACELPNDSGLPFSHWTPPELAREAVKRGIVDSISPRQVDRFLARRTCDRTRASTG
jgi:transposase